MKKVWRLVRNGFFYDYNDMLVAFLVMDIQRTPQWARELADRIEQVKTGKLAVWERIGNAYRLELTDQGALIEDLADEDSPAQKITPGEITLGETSKAVEAWIRAL